MTMSETTSRSTGKWSRPGVPHKGWVCIDIEDLGEPTAVCEMCETQEIRYVHYMQHPTYAEALGCGCICAGRMEEDYASAHKREKALRNAASRKQRWLSRAWRVSSNGNPYINADGYNIVVFPVQSFSGGGWGFRVKNRNTDASLQSRNPCPSCDAAKLRAFDAMILLKDRAT
jgi:hypothetical protein